MNGRCEPTSVDIIATVLIICYVVLFAVWQIKWSLHLLNCIESPRCKVVIIEDKEHRILSIGEYDETTNTYRKNTRTEE